MRAGFCCWGVCYDAACYWSYNKAGNDDTTAFECNFSKYIDQAEPPTAFLIFYQIITSSLSFCADILKLVKTYV